MHSSKLSIHIKPTKASGILSSPSLPQYNQHMCLLSPNNNKYNSAISIDDKRPMSQNSTPTNRMILDYNKVAQNNFFSHTNVSPKRNLTKKSSISVFESIMASDKKPTLKPSDIQALSIARNKVATLLGHSPHYE
jgi:hypothetical protein